MKSFLLIPCLTLLLGAGAPAPNSDVRIGPLKNQTIVEGCGCYFSRTGDATNRLVLAVDAADTAWLNLDGADTWLVLVRTTRGGGAEKAGDMYSEFYRGRGYDLQVDYTVTYVCPPTDESCEFTGMNAFITVRRGAAKGHATVTGNCGC
jgi:hypothetical protein